MRTDAGTWSKDAESRNLHFNLFQGPSNYAFGYSVKDDYSGDDFSHNEVRDGYKTEGEYRVALPDGRVQIVSYVADENGYQADVRKSVTIRAIKMNFNFNDRS